MHYVFLDFGISCGQSSFNIKFSNGSFKMRKPESLKAIDA